MSEEKLLTGLAEIANSIQHEPVDLTAGVMKSIRQELYAESQKQDEVEQASFNVFYWASGISIAVVVIALIGLSFYSEQLLSFSDYSLFGLLVSS